MALFVAQAFLHVQSLEGPVLPSSGH